MAPPDVIADLGHLFLGSRLKRLAERLQTDAAKVHHAAGIDAQPAEVALLAAVDRLGPLTISAAVEALGVSQPGVTRTAAGLVERELLTAVVGESDQRQKTLKLTRKGRSLIVKAKTSAWPRIARAVEEMCSSQAGDLLEQIADLEARLSEKSLEARARDVAPGGALIIREYSDDLATAFHTINEEWIASMFTMEEKDREILRHPRAKIVDTGGVVLFVEAADLGVVGTCALMKVEEGVFELTKMGVLEKARGRRAGELLLRTAIARADAMAIDTLYLLTSRKCVAAIALYEKFGFVHDAAIMEKYGAAYARCDVAMRYRGSRRGSRG